MKLRISRKDSSKTKTDSSVESKPNETKSKKLKARFRWQPEYWIPVVIFFLVQVVLYLRTTKVAYAFTRRRLTSKPDGRLLVLTMNRPKSLKRLLNSLSAADYGYDVINLDIWIDIPIGEEQADVRTLNITKKFYWRYGLYNVHVQKQNVGLRAQWLHAWNASVRGGLRYRTKEKAVIFEDDLEVSPYYWIWLKQAYDVYGGRPEIAGFSLQRANLCPKFCNSLNGGPGNGGAFMSLLIGSWGFSPKLQHWMKFTKWAEDYVNSDKKPYVEGLITTKWYKQFESSGRCPGPNCMWTALHIKYVSENFDRYTVYVKCRNNRALAANHQLPGLHYDRPAGQDSAVLKRWDTSLSSFPNPPIKIGWDGKKIAEEAYLLLARQIHENFGVVNIQFLDSGFVSSGKCLQNHLLQVTMAKHWICNVRTLPGEILQRTLFIAVDEAAYLTLQDFDQGRNELNIALEKFLKEQDEGKTLEYGQVGYYNFMLWRTHILLSLLYADITIMLTEADAVWLRNPFEILRKSADIQVMDDNPPKHRPQGGFMILSATQATRDAFEEILRRQQVIMVPYVSSNLTRDIGEKGNEQYIEERVLKSRSRRRLLNYAWLPDTFTSGKYYTSEYLRKKDNYHVILFNWIIGQENKITRARAYGHWYLDETNTYCEIPIPPAELPPIPEGASAEDAEVRDEQELAAMKA